MANQQQAQKSSDDAKLDKMIDDSFPASDPPSTTPAAGTRRSTETVDAHAHGHGENAPAGSPHGDRYATETAAARQHGVHPPETDDRSGEE